MAGIIPWVPPTEPAPPAPTPIQSPPIQVVAGLDPNELAAATYGQKIPVFVGGKARLGGRIIFGPYLEAGTATFAVSFGMALPTNGTRVLYEIAFDSKLAWQSSGGTATISAGTFLAETFTARFYQGTQTQAVDPLETAKFGAYGIAYRPHMVIFFENLPLAPFNNKVPWVAALIGDTTDGADPDDGLTLGEVYERTAYSPFLEYTSDTFETVNCDDVVDAVIWHQDNDLLTEIRNIGRFYRSQRIIQSDKLRVVDRGDDVASDIVLDRTRLVAGPVQFSKDATTSIPRELELITIDPDADYVLLPSKAQFPRDPVAVTGSVGRESVLLPIVINSHTRLSIATYAKHQEEIARKKVSFAAMPYGFEIEPGDYVALVDLADGFDTEVIDIMETTHNADWSVSCVGEAVLRCDIPTVEDPDFNLIVVLLGGNGTDGSTTIPDEGPLNKTTADREDAEIDTAQKVFGTGSILIGGSGSDGVAVSGLGDTDFNLLSSWTFEFFVRFSAVTADQSFFGTWDPPSSGYMLMFAATPDELQWFCVGGTNFTVPWSPSVDTWYYVCIHRDGTTTRIHVGTPSGNATMIGSTTGVQNGENVRGFGVGNDTGTAGGRPVSGWIDEFRFTNGLDRYPTSGTYAVPTAEFPREE